MRVRPRTLLTVVALTGAFYLLLPQLANVDDSFRALRSANWGWLAVCVVMSGLTYVASAIGMAVACPSACRSSRRQAQLASSFVNRVTPANVGGMALNVRFMQKAGIDPGAGGHRHGPERRSPAASSTSSCWSSSSPGRARAARAASPSRPAASCSSPSPSSWRSAGIVAATARGRRLFQTHVLRFLKQSWRSLSTLARSPSRLLAALRRLVRRDPGLHRRARAAGAALDGDVSFAQVGAVYLGSSLIAAAAPTPGGLGAMEAALVAGFTGVGVEPGIAVAVVLTYRLATFWLPILPGWLSFQALQRRNLI